MIAECFYLVQKQKYEAIDSNKFLIWNTFPAIVWAIIDSKMNEKAESMNLNLLKFGFQKNRHANEKFSVLPYLVIQVSYVWNLKIKLKGTI